MKTYKIIDMGAILAVMVFLAYTGGIFLKPDAKISNSTRLELLSSPTVSEAEYDGTELQSQATPVYACSADTSGSSFSDFTGSPYFSHQITDDDFDRFAASSYVHQPDAEKESIPSPNGSSGDFLDPEETLTGPTKGLASGGEKSSPSSKGSPSFAESPKKFPTPGNGGGSVEIADVKVQPKGIASTFFPSGELTINDRPLPLSKMMEKLLKYDAFWSAQTITDKHAEVFRRLRTEYPEKIVLYYVSLFTVRPDAPDSYLDFGFIEKHHPEWFLLQDEKNAVAQDYRNWHKRIRWNPSDPTDWRYNRFFLDVGNPAFQNWAANAFLEKLEAAAGNNAQIRYSGIGGDNGLFHAWAIEKSQSYPNWKYQDSTGSKWTRAYISYLRKVHELLKSKGYILIVNSTIDYYDSKYREEWEHLTEAVDGIMKEWGVRHSKGLYGGPYWESIIQYHEDTINRGLYDWWLFEAFSDYKKLPFTRYQHFLYEYCSFLLIKHPQLSFYGVHNADLRLEWFEEFDLPLGDPVGERYQYKGCWLRDYQNGKVVVNPTSFSCTIPLHSDIYTLDWVTKNTITQLTLEPYSATILLPTGYRVR